MSTSVHSRWPGSSLAERRSFLQQRLARMGGSASLSRLRTRTGKEKTPAPQNPLRPVALPRCRPTFEENPQTHCKQDGNFGYSFVFVLGSFFFNFVDFC